MRSSNQEGFLFAKNQILRARSVYIRERKLMIYDLVLAVIALLAFPKYLYQLIVFRKYRNNFWQRLGYHLPLIDKGSRRLVWIHAVSMGEAKAVISLAKMLKEKNKDLCVVFSTITETGLAEGKKGIPKADCHIYLPFDFKWIIAPVVKAFKPDLVIITETDYWFNFLDACKKIGAKIVLANGKISERSLKRFLFMKSFSNRLFSLFDLFLVQSRHYAKRYRQLRVAREKIIVTGNMKFDHEFSHMPKHELEKWKLNLGIETGDQILVAGSTHYPEESLILNSFEKLQKTFPKLKLLLVPRHPERFDEVARLIEKRGIKYSRYSKPLSHKTAVALIDAAGILKQCYQFATIAIVAGSFTPKIGGHNIIEPCVYGIPVVFGPYMHSQPQLVELIAQYQAGCQVQPEQLTEVIYSLLVDENKRKSLGANGIKLTKETKGATEKTFDRILLICPFVRNYTDRDSKSRVLNHNQHDRQITNI